ncbi:hypothetical protein RclHR1_06730005 [Rhizophagus clarus]|uniref:Clathrin light chain n=1 Tax=Rhizophagus clarus TaxID=94130 RepID=A0A2Z6SJR5_9GLOM|nr:hypothetical protein RclHR1_06730005 [Rhizophagus clarus]GES72804.1 hypothetical protein RCL_jg15459.t1 [Rhizophagus clarus]
MDNERSNGIQHMRNKEDIRRQNEETTLDTTIKSINKIDLMETIKQEKDAIKNNVRSKYFEAEKHKQTEITKNIWVEDVKLKNIAHGEGFVDNIDKRQEKIDNNWISFT